MSRRVGKSASPEAGPSSDLARYLPSASRPATRSSKPRTPQPGTPDASRMATKQISGPPPRDAQVKVTNKNNRPTRLVGTGGPVLNKRSGR